MICAACKAYIDVTRNHVWRMELRDTEPRSDTSYLMLGAALCHDCAMNVADVIKTGMLPEAKEKEFSFELTAPLSKENYISLSKEDYSNLVGKENHD